MENAIKEESVIDGKRFRYVCRTHNDKGNWYTTEDEARKEYLTNHLPKFTGNHDLIIEAQI